MRSSRPLPAWAIKRNRERDAEARDRAHRFGIVMGGSIVDIVWSNDTMLAYHPRCRGFIPHGPLGVVEMGVAPFDERACGHCGARLCEEEETDAPTR